MKRFLFLILLPVLAQAQHPLDARAGKALFDRNWVKAPASTAASDGLGPLYNARSCATCHPAGGRADSLQALTLHLDDPVYGRQLQLLALPELLPEASAELLYKPVALEIAGQTFMLQELTVTVSNLHYGPLQSDWSARLAPALSGLAGLERVSEETLEALADPDDVDGDGISGVISRPQGPTGPVGRFGWKAGSTSLREQVALAFSLDLGLGSPAMPSPRGDCTGAQTACLTLPSGEITGSGQFELSDEILELVLTYLISIENKASVLQDGPGLRIFRALGCAACHVPVLLVADGNIRAFSDLLLHDMGDVLADSLGPDLVHRREWRTPPLRGLSGTTRLLHDGRAGTLEEAILWHDGEAARARAAWLELAPAEKADLLQFLFTL